MSRSEEKQLKVLRYIYESIQNNGFPPTIREIGDGLNLSSSATVQGYVTRLQQKEYLKRNLLKSRTLEITPSGLNVLGIQVQATVPLIETPWANFIPDHAPQYPLPKHLSRYAGELFIFQINNKNMQSIGISVGDLLYIHRQKNAENGEIVAYLNENQEIKIARFFRERAQYRLQPENELIAPDIMFRNTVIGRVMSVFRPYVY
ncbi:repressor LexA [Weissella coleopterorum]|uniref:Repressor LexA n=1 Tax=Weissella coleopterorum TaxID=2714949 RepID=A0A6G8B114_9LACO|nr:S24 family peptidase [Weissella coleopterorum]QIL50905.1 repressor LexA [Weissella coleopterorum]